MVLQRGWSWASEKASAFSYLSADVYWALWASDTLTTGRAAPGHLQLFSLRLPSCFNSLTSDPSQGTLCLQILPHSSQMASAIRKWSRLKRHQKSQKPLEPRARFFEHMANGEGYYKGNFFSLSYSDQELSLLSCFLHSTSIMPCTQEIIGTCLPFSFANPKCLTLARPHAKTSLIQGSQVSTCGTTSSQSGNRYRVWAPFTAHLDSAIQPPPGPRHIATSSTRQPWTFATASQPQTSLLMPCSN